MANKEKANQMTDSIVLAELGQRLAQYRLKQNLTQAELANEAGVSKRTLERLEAGGSTQLTNLIRILRVLGLLNNLDSFVPPPPSSPVELLRMQGKERKRASGRSAQSKQGEKDWTWGNENDGDGES
ncbi:MAG: helix-turn-helix transcriptional regulator [Phycisphaerales bacterium]|nr:helix-turn-helix transcriptional regulator [Phycisphaerales bacterium]